MHSSLFTLLLPTTLLLTLTTSLPTNQSSSTSTTRTCQDYLIPLTTTSVEAIPAFAPFDDNFDVASFISSLAARDASTSFAPFSEKRNVTHSYNISGTICSPVVVTEQAKAVLLATHGLGFDRRYVFPKDYSSRLLIFLVRYWDIRMNAEKYSFVDYAISRGYSVFFYDRLGVGLSSKYVSPHSYLPHQGFNPSSEYQDTMELKLALN
jgi:hypothetical protein